MDLRNVARLAVVAFQPLEPQVENLSCSSRISISGVVIEVSEMQPTLNSGRLCRTIRITDGKVE